MYMYCRCAALWFLSVKPGRLRTAVIQGTLSLTLNSASVHH